jgi:hypothetical protein
MSDKIYTVICTIEGRDGWTHHVRASSRAQAAAHVREQHRPVVAVRAASQDELLDLGRRGTVIEVAGEYCQAQTIPSDIEVTE